MSARGGRKTLAIYLKACQLLLMKYVAGDRVDNPRVFGAAVALRGGLPEIIPKDHRKMIRAGDLRVVRF